MLTQRELVERNRLMLHALRDGIELKLGGMAVSGLVHYTTDVCGFDSGVHRHRHYELSTLLAGGMRYRLERDQAEEVTLDGGSNRWVMIAPELPHRRRSLCNGSLLLGYTLNFKNPPPSFRRCIENRMLMLDGTAVCGELARIEELVTSDAPFRAERLRLRLTELLLEFFADAFGSMLGGEPATGSSGDILELAGYYIEENLTRNILADDIARQVGISRRHLYRLFTEKHGMPLREYIIRQRLARAAAALIGGDRPVKEIAELAGFRNLSYFTRQFHRVYTTSPARYRRLGG